MKEKPKSPCIHQCFFDHKIKSCTGCFRTLDEISNWRLFTEEEREAIIKECSQRKADNTKTT